MRFWVTRNKSGTLVLWFNKPVKQGDTWYSNDGFFILDPDQFPEITFENSPRMVELKLVKE